MLLRDKKRRINIVHLEAMMRRKKLVCLSSYCFLNKQVTHVNKEINKKVSYCQNVILQSLSLRAEVSVPSL